MATRAKLTDPFGIPRNLGPGVNSPANEYAPSISADGLALYFDSDRPGGLGSFDIWMATRKTTAEHFDYARNLGAPVNSVASDGLPNISTDGFLALLLLASPGRCRRDGPVGRVARL